MNYIGPDKIIEKKKAYLYPCAQHFYKDPPQIVKGEMQYLFDHEGKRYLDFFAGVSVVNCGHCNPTIVEKTIEQLKTLHHTTTIYLNQPIVDLAERMAEILPGDLRRSFFCNSGSEANEGALLLARLYTGKKAFITLENSLHGRTHLTMNVTAIPMWRTDPYLGDAVHIAKSIANAEGSLDQRAKASLQSVADILKAHNDIAAMIVEPIQGNGGMITPPDWYFRELIDLLHDHDALLIADEIQTGFARSGKMFAIETFGVVPDIMTVAKALGNGIPISAFCTSDKIAEVFTKPSASTLGGNPVASKTALAVLDYIEDNHLCDRASQLGDRLAVGLNDLAERYGCITDVRGKGLMLGMEIQDFKGREAPEITDTILEDMKNNGFLIGKNGINRNVLAFQPPLVLTENDIDQMLEQLDRILSTVK